MSPFNEKGMPKECCWFEEMFPTEFSICSLKYFFFNFLNCSGFPIYILVHYCSVLYSLQRSWWHLRNFSQIISSFLLCFTFCCWWPQLCKALWNRIQTRIHLALLDPDLDRIGNADPDPDPGARQLTELTKKPECQPFKRLLYLRRYVLWLLPAGKVWPGSGSGSALNLI